MTKKSKIADPQDPHYFKIIFPMHSLKFHLDNDVL